MKRSAFSWTTHTTAYEAHPQPEVTSYSPALAIIDPFAHIYRTEYKPRKRNGTNHLSMRMTNSEIISFWW